MLGLRPGRSAPRHDGRFEGPGRPRGRGSGCSHEDRPCVVDFHVEAEENVLPMVPPGKGLHEMECLRSLQNAM